MSAPASYPEFEDSRPPPQQPNTDIPSSHKSKSKSKSKDKDEKKPSWFKSDWRDGKKGEMVMVRRKDGTYEVRVREKGGKKGKKNGGVLVAFEGHEQGGLLGKSIFQALTMSEGAAEGDVSQQPQEEQEQAAPAADNASKTPSSKSNKPKRTKMKLRKPEKRVKASPKPPKPKTMRLGGFYTDLLAPDPTFDFDRRLKEEGIVANNESSSLPSNYRDGVYSDPGGDGEGGGEDKEKVVEGSGNHCSGGTAQLDRDDGSWARCYAGGVSGGYQQYQTGGEIHVRRSCYGMPAISPEREGLRQLREEQGWVPWAW
ncbi:hypothetical protein B0T14DRAFT_568047 [Immersiella caudata]|uniref:Uncharacterized protein n=1 Tax=Immersiella caudata TaxID=314043 RepID=A0AA40BWR1_9PEZI|nr:hypothetical protein B0T14DRAFT_568047 [Immersiella caudata]